MQGVKERGGVGQQEKVDLWGLWGGGCKRTHHPPSLRACNYCKPPYGNQLL